MTTVALKKNQKDRLAWLNTHLSQDPNAIPKHGSGFFDPAHKDLARITHSESFRKLQRKTQIFNLGDADFYRTRMTHTLEVAQIASGILAQFHNTAQKYAHFDLSYLPSATQLTTICLAHDLGHPPFGHGGERVLNMLMRNHGGFEGNGQTIRVLTRLETFHHTYGLDPIRRTLLGILKYPHSYSEVCNPKAYPESEHAPHMHYSKFIPPKCFMDSDTELMHKAVFSLLPDDAVTWIRTKQFKDENTHAVAIHRNLDTSIMEIADDIAYGVHDIEDEIIFGFLKPEHFDDIKPELISFTGVENIVSHLFSGDAYLRKKAIGLIVKCLISQTTLERTSYKGAFPLFQINATLSKIAKVCINALKDISTVQAIETSKVQKLNYKGQLMISRIFEAFMNSGDMLLPLSMRNSFKQSQQKERFICDHIASMTDDQATSLYAQLFLPGQGSTLDF